MVPLGVSSLNSPGRYMSTVVLTEGSSYLALPLKTFFDLLVIDQQAGAYLMSLVLSRATELLWATRSLKPPTPEMPAGQADGVAFKNDRDILKRLADTAFFAELDKDQLPALIAYGELQLFASNDVILKKAKTVTI